MTAGLRRAPGGQRGGATSIPRTAATTSNNRENNQAKTKVGYFEIAGENEGGSSTGNGDSGENEGWLLNRIISYVTGYAVG
eukprot:6951888-Prymnesium_polylepis.1